jgi:hypothetical protein
MKAWIVLAALVAASPAFAQMGDPKVDRMVCADYLRTVGSTKDALARTKTGDAEADAAMAEVLGKVLETCRKQPRITVREAVTKAMAEDEGD